MVEQQRVIVVAGRGLEGDRYFSAEGTWSATPGTGRHVTLIEEEAVEALAREHSIKIQAAPARGKIITSRHPPDPLGGPRFAAGPVLPPRHGPAARCQP